MADSAPRETVTGIGGVFFRSQNPEKTRAWYKEMLGVAEHEFPGAGSAQIFKWRGCGETDQHAYTVWTPMPEETDYFSPSSVPFMINYRVRDLDAMLDQLRADGVAVLDGPTPWFNGRFAWVMDPEGRKIELWEPAEGH